MLGRRQIVRLMCSRTAPAVGKASKKGKADTVSTSTANLEIATRQKLYMLDSSSPGSVFFLPHGVRIFNKLLQFMKQQQDKQKFTEVITPLMYKKDLWETSGHWDKYAEDMFRVEGNDKSKLTEEEQEDVYGLKPMNCPGHCVIYKRFAKSHNELPVRFSDWSSLHRNEASGALTGLTRVRRFHQDDGHIFCREDQVGDEISKTLKLIKICYGVFGLDDYKMRLSTRPENHIGEGPEWDRAERALADVLDQEQGKGNWDLNEGDGAFYGPKIDIVLKDQFGKEHQVATIQLDFQLPHRFDLKYQKEEGHGVPIMIHRAIFGSVERFMALLMDHYGGKWPFWLSPRQAVVIPVNETHSAYAAEVARALGGETEDFSAATRMGARKFYVDVNSKNETVGMRTKRAIAEGYNYIVLVGDKEVESGLVAVRERSDRRVKTMTVQDLRSMSEELEDSYQ